MVALDTPRVLAHGLRVRERGRVHEDDAVGASHADFVANPRHDVRAKITVRTAFNAVLQHVAFSPVEVGLGKVDGKRALRACHRRVDGRRARVREQVQEAPADRKLRDLRARRAMVEEQAGVEVRAEVDFEHAAVLLHRRLARARGDAAVLPAALLVLANAVEDLVGVDAEHDRRKRQDVAHPSLRPLHVHAARRLVLGDDQVRLPARFFGAMVDVNGDRVVGQIGVVYAIAGDMVLFRPLAAFFRALLQTRGELLGSLLEHRNDALAVRQDVEDGDLAPLCGLDADVTAHVRLHLAQADAFRTHHRARSDIALDGIVVGHDHVFPAARQRHEHVKQPAVGFQSQRIGGILAERQDRRRNTAHRDAVLRRRLVALARVGSVGRSSLSPFVAGCVRLIVCRRCVGIPRMLQVSSIIVGHFVRQGIFGNVLLDSRDVGRLGRIRSIGRALRLVGGLLLQACELGSLQAAQRGIEHFHDARDSLFVLSVDHRHILGKARTLEHGDNVLLNAIVQRKRIERRHVFKRGIKPVLGLFEQLVPNVLVMAVPSHESPPGARQVRRHVGSDHGGFRHQVAVAAQRVDERLSFAGRTLPPRGFERSGREGAFRAVAAHARTLVGTVVQGGPDQVDGDGRTIPANVDVDQHVRPGQVHVGALAAARTQGIAQAVLCAQRRELGIAQFVVRAMAEHADGLSDRNLPRPGHRLHAFVQFGLVLRITATDHVEHARRKARPQARFVRVAEFAVESDPAAQRTGALDADLLFELVGKRELHAASAARKKLHERTVVHPLVNLFVVCEVKVVLQRSPLFEIRLPLATVRAVRTLRAETARIAVEALAAVSAFEAFCAIARPTTVETALAVAPVEPAALAVAIEALATALAIAVVPLAARTPIAVEALAAAVIAVEPAPAVVGIATVETALAVASLETLPVAVELPTAIAAIAIMASTTARTTVRAAPAETARTTAVTAAAAVSPVIVMFVVFHSFLARKEPLHGEAARPICPNLPDSPSVSKTGKDAAASQASCFRSDEYARA